MKTPVQISEGVAQFNRQEFFECHETLEEYWLTQTGPDRELTQGVIQIAVGYYHLLRNNPVGAIKLFERGLGRISQFRPEHLGLDLEQLACGVEQSLQLAKDANFQGISSINTPQIRYHD